MVPLQLVMLRLPEAEAEILPLKVRTFEPLPELWLSVPQVVVSDAEEQVTGSLNATET